MNEDLQRAIARAPNGRYVDPLTERLFSCYVDDRVGNRGRDGLTHAQIVADGVYGALAEHFGLRYSLEQSAYLDAMKERDRDPHRDRGGLQGSPYGHTYRAGQ